MTKGRLKGSSQLFKTKQVSMGIFLVTSSLSEVNVKRASEWILMVLLGPRVGGTKVDLTKEWFSSPPMLRENPRSQEC